MAHLLIVVIEVILTKHQVCTCSRETALHLPHARSDMTPSDTIQNEISFRQSPEHNMDFKMLENLQNQDWHVRRAAVGQLRSCTAAERAPLLPSIVGMLCTPTPSPIPDSRRRDGLHDEQAALQELAVKVRITLPSRLTVFTPLGSIQVMVACTEHERRPFMSHFSAMLHADNANVRRAGIMVMKVRQILVLDSF